MEVIGVDFSGAVSDKTTWMARASMDGRVLELEECRPVARAELADILTQVPAPAVAALDFPFSVPIEFAREWMPQANSMIDLWKAAASMDLSQFMVLRDAFVSRRGEIKRECDAFYPESFSCLHKVNPNMVPMTFHGMRMLDRLWAAGCAVPPLESTNGDSTVLLEAMPGAVLRVFKLPIKGYKNGANAMGLRRRILDGLPQRSGLSLPNLDEYRDLCMASHDCLDAVAAAIAAALWAIDPGIFRHPPANGRTVQLEGWLYAPAFIDLPES